MIVLRTFKSAWEKITFKAILKASMHRSRNVLVMMSGVKMRQKS